METHTPPSRIKSWGFLVAIVAVILAIITFLGIQLAA